MNQCEVTYVNHIPIGDAAESGRRVLRGHAQDPFRDRGSSHGLSAGIRSHDAERRYLMPDKKGRLYVTVQPVVRKDDRRPVLQLTLTARGRPDSASTEDVLRWFDLGHEWIVRGFADLTTADMHRRWERIV